MRSDIVGPAILAAGGIAWLAVAIVQGFWTEALICGSVASGFLLVVWGLLGTPRLALVALGFGVEAVAAALPWIVYGGNGLDLGILWTILAMVGFAVAGYGAARGSTPAVRLGLAAGIPLAGMNVIQSELAGHVNLWSPGNVLVLAGTIWTVAVGLRPPGDATARPPGDATA